MSDDSRIKEDINGRIYSLDQGFMSLEKRVHAIEKRLSAGEISECLQQTNNPELEEEIEEIREYLAVIMERLMEYKNSQWLDEELAASRQLVLELNKQMDLLNEGTSKTQTVCDPVGPDYEQLVAELRNEIATLSQRLDKAENQNRIHIGSMKVPLEMSGIIGALVLVLTGGLIVTERWDIIHSPYFSFSIALVFAVAVLIKFYFENNRDQIKRHRLT
jgi:DNA-binding transcriptional MerR regulator